MCLSTILNILTTLLLLATLVVLIIYTRATWLLKEETIKQTDLSQRPFVMIIEAGNQRLKYKNSGQGIALNIRIKDIFEEAYTFTFKRENLLSPNEVSKGDINPVARDNKTGEPYPSNIETPFTPYELRSNKLTVTRILEIQYENIENKLYQTSVRVRKEGIEYYSTDEAYSYLVK
jgi:hypothetical protein